MKNLFTALDTYLTLTAQEVITQLRKDVNINMSSDDKWFYSGPKNPELVLVAHIDTVNDPNIPAPKLHEIDRSDTEVSLTRGAMSYCLGTDDRAGIVGCLQLLSAYGTEHMGVLFTNYEEKGGLGARDFCHCFDFKKDFTNTKLFVEFDRRGTEHYVDYCGNPVEMKTWVDKLGWKQEAGTFSDVYFISQVSKIPSINVATGYYNEHSRNERLVLADWFEGILYITRIIEGIKDAPLCRIERNEGWLF